VTAVKREPTGVEEAVHGAFLAQAIRDVSALLQADGEAAGSQLLLAAIAIQLWARRSSSSSSRDAEAQQAALDFSTVLQGRPAGCTTGPPEVLLVVRHTVLRDTQVNSPHLAQRQKGMTAGCRSTQCGAHSAHQGGIAGVLDNLGSSLPAIPLAVLAIHHHLGCGLGADLLAIREAVVAALAVLELGWG
jgi:hypothetical protein